MQPADGFADGLWQHSCFELFVGDPGGTAYVEWNLSPSGQWAAYRFADYRHGQSPLPAARPQFEWRFADRRWCLSVELTKALLAAVLPPRTGHTPNSPLPLGLSAVIETADEQRHYFALAHTRPQPDFHCRDAWRLSLEHP